MQALTCNYADFSSYQQTSKASSRILILKSTFIGKKMSSKTNKRGSKQVANRPKQKRIRTMRLINLASQGTEHDLAPGAVDNVACAPSDQSQDLDGDPPYHKSRHM